MAKHSAPGYLDWYSNRVDLYLDETGLDEYGYARIRRADMSPAILNIDGRFSQRIAKAMQDEEDYGEPHVAAFLADYSGMIEYAASLNSEDPGYFHDEQVGSLEPVREYLSIYFPEYANFNANDVGNMLP
jgi:hypothetical protein